ncbi:septal ring lytic transglycosylase RlpA family protein [Croceicoccus naphthovorans]|nr:septal ring lytic transglycosylase RlpA family protein [Croceicoccus naphthovorans]MBB3990753.1 rare lipoprotein A [Croceicoccus naphthovorans]
MDGTIQKRSAQRRASRLALGFAIVALVPATAALAVSEDVQAARPGFETDLQSDIDLAPLPGMGNDAAPFAEPEPANDASDVAEELGIGMASWYGPKFAGRPTASGERFNPAEYTAAHRTLPFGSKVRVTSPRTGKSIVVRINDRGPFHGKRVIDLSEAAADAIGLKARGHDRVTLSLLEG